MNSNFWTIFVGVLGTIAGVVISNLSTLWSARGARRHAERQEYRTAALEAATSLLVAVAEHRTSMFRIGEAVLNGQDADVTGALRDRTHQTRSGITRPLVSVKILLPAATGLAERAVAAVYAMRHPTDTDALEQGRRAAAAAADDLAAAVTDLLRAHLGTRPKRARRPRTSGPASGVGPTVTPLTEQRSER